MTTFQEVVDSAKSKNLQIQLWTLESVSPIFSTQLFSKYGWNIPRMPAQQLNFYGGISLAS